MGRSEQNTGTLSPGASRPAFLSGTEQASAATVEPTRLRLNDSLKGLWMLTGIGSGQEGTSFHPWQNYGEKERKMGQDEFGWRAIEWALSPRHVNHGELLNEDYEAALQAVRRLRLVNEKRLAALILSEEADNYGPTEASRLGLLEKASLARIECLRDV